MAIKTITRLTLERRLQTIFQPHSFKSVLEIGASQTWSPYRELFQAQQYISLDYDQSFGPHVCGDICHTGFQQNSFDAVLLFEVLEHIFYPHQAINEVHRVLKPNGLCLLSTRFIFQYHPSPKDYYRFTEDALQALFKSFHEVTVLSHGNQLQAVWQLILARELELPRSFWIKALRRFNRLCAISKRTDRRAPLGYLVKAIK
ncbi:methyltransferase domain-containing protein [candidate division KSB1 bacterium]|nr:methyltransferase domain-containing protein [candidate division KSB1 bacterium]